MEKLIQTGLVSHMDIHFARLMVKLEGRDVPELFLAAALVSTYKSKGDVCLDLSDIGGTAVTDNGEDSFVCPETDLWVEKLDKTSVVGKPGELKPLILDTKNRLYMYRYWEYQDNLVNLIKKRILEFDHHVDLIKLKQGLHRLFPESCQNGDTAPDPQALSAFTAIYKKFSIISGGPGTGKTTIVAKILALLLEQKERQKLSIALCAPTGKAAARLQEAIKSSKKNLNCSSSIKEKIPDDACTIHRLLGTIQGSPYFRFNKENKLPFDVVVVDEASMVDIALMSKLMDSLKQDAGIVILGDKDQLASVEAGAVLGDICSADKNSGFTLGFAEALKEVFEYNFGPHKSKKETSSVSECVVKLVKSYRFGEKSGINKVSRAVNIGDGDTATMLLKQGKYRDISFMEVPRTEPLRHFIKEIAISGFTGYLKCKTPIEALQAFDRFRILCALRKGPFGVANINMLVEKILEDNRLIKSDNTWYAGRPVMINSNDYNLGLFNGDVGITLNEPDEGNDLKVFFPCPKRGVKMFHPSRLNDYETVFAMTVHKSQGSEFDKVLLLLPDRHSPVLTRELIYTGITRAKESVDIWGFEDVLRKGILKKTKRSSGLYDALSC